MSITELTARVKSAGKNRSHAECIQLLEKAHVLDSKGNFDQRFFRSEKKIQVPLNNVFIKAIYCLWFSWYR